MRVVRAVVEVGGIPGRGISGTTRSTKSQLDAIFQKTATRRQAELVRLITGYAKSGSAHLAAASLPRIHCSARMLTKLTSPAVVCARPPRVMIQAVEAAPEWRTRGYRDAPRRTVGHCA